VRYPHYPHPLPHAAVDLEQWIALPIDQVVRDLTDLGFQRRREAIAGLLSKQDTRVLAILLGIIHTDLREDAIECCTRMPIDFLLDELRRTAVEEGEPARAAARSLLDDLQITVLAPPKVGDKFVNIIAVRIAALKHPDPWIRKQAARELPNYIWYGDVITALRQVAENDPDQQVRRVAADAAKEALSSDVMRRMSRALRVHTVPVAPIGPLIDDILTLIPGDGCWYSIPCGEGNTGRYHLHDLEKAVGDAVVPHLVRNLTVADDALMINAILELLQKHEHCAEGSWIKPLVRTLTFPRRCGDTVFYGSAGRLLQRLGQSAIDQLVAELPRQADPYEIAKLLLLLGRLDGLETVLGEFPTSSAPLGPPPPQRPAPSLFERYAMAPFGIREQDLPAGDQRADEICDALSKLLNTCPSTFTIQQLQAVARIGDVRNRVGGDCIWYVGISFAEVRDLALREYHQRRR
jgi:hypothetical protein